jgi:hypothetical protein
MTGCARIMEALLVRIRIVILDLVVALVIAECLDDLNLSFECSPFCRSVCGTWYGRGSRRCTGLCTWQLDYFFLDFALLRFCILTPLSFSHRFAIAGLFACIHFRCFFDLKGIGGKSER